MLFQEGSPGNDLIRKIIDIVNYNFINQPQFKISLLSLILLSLLMAIVFSVSHYVRKLLGRSRWMEQLDAGLRFTILRILHYLIIAFGVLYGLKIGFNADLTSIAVLVGFLSVGIGFGLQYIASDLISGLILLFERPIRVGDRLKLGDIEGRVENIQIRTTLIITNDNIAVIVPNSDLVRGQLINWSYSNHNVRIRIPVGVSYSSDLEVVSRALIEVGNSVSDVLADPAPKAQLRSFGDSSIDFELLVWISEPHKHPQIRSDINFAIARTFRERGIEIPFPQRDLHIREVESKK
ncbi:MAG: mechanosensitive ion channel [Acidobacteriota bacterium]|nr:MAG: mechanosensitive ion channel [Acidobacteriota bacterium]